MVHNDYIILWLPFGNERCLGKTSPINCLMGSSSNYGWIYINGGFSSHGADETGGYEPISSATHWMKQGLITCRMT